MLIAPGDAMPRHTRVELRFDDGATLAYVCMRMLGEVGWTPSVDRFIADRGVGPDALGEKLTRQRFFRLLDGRTKNVKSTLMDQSIVAGIGNVWSDDILLQAGVHPLRQARSLTGDERGRLYRMMRRQLAQAMRRGGDARDMPGWYLLPDRGEGRPCPRCGGDLASVKVARRTAVFCPRCQPSP